MNFRLADHRDALQIARLHAGSWRAAYRGAMTDAYLDGDIDAERASVWTARFADPDANQRVVLAESDGEVVGFACTFLDLDPDWGSYVDNLHVAQARWGGGIGAGLLAATARVCQADARHPGLFLWVLEANARARRFYERAGGEFGGTGTWDPPDGTPLPKLRFAWKDLATLVRLA